MGLKSGVVACLVVAVILLHVHDVLAHDPTNRADVVRGLMGSPLGKRIVASMGKRPNELYSFGIGKRVAHIVDNDDDVGVVIKESPELFDKDLDQDLDEPHVLRPMSKMIVTRRSPYSFGLGKRDPYAFGLGKRDPYAFGLGKKRGDMYAMGLGK